ncbi:MAG TPA: hypothetical protein VG389_26095 [Myxococcota bacterium]|jgi:hypothetical protein|nr:hypothetical protein [Myxococcota bacterium]
MKTHIESRAAPVHVSADASAATAAPRAPRAALAGATFLAGAMVVAVVAACAGTGCAAVAPEPPDEVAAAEFPLALLVLDTQLVGAPSSDGQLTLELCSASLSLRNDAPVPVDGVAVVGVTILRAEGGEPVLSLGGVASPPDTVSAGAQLLIPLEAAAAGALTAACGEELVVEAVVAAEGVVTSVRGHAAPIACP